MINSLFCTVLTPGASTNIYKPNSQIQIWHSSFRFDRTMFSSKWMMWTMLFTTTLNTMTNSWICTVFSLGASKFESRCSFIATLTKLYIVKTTPKPVITVLGNQPFLLYSFTERCRLYENIKDCFKLIAFRTTKLIWLIYKYVINE